MRSTSIYYRVADFLKAFPPFSFVLEEDLLRLSGSGRVKFHESDEYVYWQGRKPGRFVFVVQQGTVELVDESRKVEALQDVLGEGDIIGAEALARKDEYQYSAKTTSDVIIYALLANELEGLAEQNPRFAGYIESNFSVVPVEVTGKSADGAAGPVGSRLPIDFLARRMLTCADDTPLQEAFERMSRQGRDTLVATNNGEPAGYLNHPLFRRSAIADVHGSTRVTDVMHKPLPVLSDALPPHSYAMEMLRCSCSAVGITDSQSTLRAVVTESDLTLFGVPNLPRLGAEIRRAQSTAELSELRRLAVRFAAQSLTEPSGVFWVAEAFTELNRLIVSRAIELTEVAAGRQEAIGSWLFFGAAARGELLTGAMPDVGLIHEDGDDELARRLGPQVTEALCQCGYHSSDDAITPANEEACRSLSEWKDSYSLWISDPVLSGLYAGLRFFELAPVRGETAPVEKLRQHIRAAVKENESFVPILANDSMANLPPLTFFQGLVVEDDGKRTDRFDLRRGTLQPLADVGRVFELERGDTSQTRTDLRLEATGAAVEEQRELFADAADTFRVALYHQARIGLRAGTGGWAIEPKALSKLEQQVLKNGFRTIMKLLDFTAKRNGIPTR